jgi:hypothetical protein
MAIATTSFLRPVSSDFRARDFDHFFVFVVIGLEPPCELLGRNEHRIERYVWAMATGMPQTSNAATAATNVAVLMHISWGDLLG